MARKRKQKSMQDLVVGAGALGVVLSVASPVFRAQMAALAGYVIVLALLATAAYLILKKRTDAAAAALEAPAASSHLETLRSRYPSAFTATQPVQPTVRAAHPAPADTVLSEMQARLAVQPSYHWTLAILRELEWKRFESVCAEYLQLVGYVSEETRVGADGGVDIRIHKVGVDNSTGIVQCKAWNSYKVGIKPVRELFGVMAAERVSIGIFMTSGEFTAEAVAFAAGKLTLVSGEKLLTLFAKLAAADQERLLTMALEGDYQTPTCPRCNVKMTLRESTQGRSAGGQFWGCVQYPKCRQTLVYKEA